ncbi:hypothetical protein H311_00175 [Anncaliia algerae PRA109]|nr:hypothetical protein H311_00175 [Anncaliia algerae PRA109]
MIPREKELKEIFEYESKALEFAQLQGIIEEIHSCRLDCAFVTKISDYKFKCRKNDCRKIYSSLTDTIFSNLKIKIHHFFRIIYLWLAKVNFNSIVIITGHSPHTIKRILNLIYDALTKNITESNLKTGGPGIQVHWMNLNSVNENIIVAVESRGLGSSEEWKKLLNVNFWHYL